MRERERERKNRKRKWRGIIKGKERERERERLSKHCEENYIEDNNNRKNIYIGRCKYENT